MDFLKSYFYVDAQKIMPDINNAVFLAFNAKN